MNTKESLIKNLHDLGISNGDVIFIRISYKAIGKTENGPQTVIDALLDVIGEHGTLLATSFPKCEKKLFRHFKNKIIFDAKTTPTTSGVIPTLICKNQNSKRSLHPLFPYVIIGKDAEKIANVHTADSDAYYIVQYLVENYNPKCLRVGGDVLDGTAHLAFTDSLRNNNKYQRRTSLGIYHYDINNQLKWKGVSSSAFCYAGFKKFYNNYLEGNVELSSGKLGNGVAVVTDMRKTHQLEMKYITSPEILSCDNPDCWLCRTSFSYSDKNIMNYIFKQFGSVFTDKRKRNHLSNIKNCLINFLFSTKCQ